MYFARSAGTNHDSARHQSVISVRRGILENFVPITASRIALSTLGLDAWHRALTQAPWFAQ